MNNNNNDPNLNDTNCYDASNILQIQFTDPEIQISFESTIDFSRTAGCDNNAYFNEIDDESRKSITCYQCEKLFDNDIAVNESWVSYNEEEKICEKIRPISDKETGNQKKFKFWKCKYNCGKIFTQEKYMNNHMLLMHENAKVISCKICFMQLSTESRLKNHMLRHSKIKHLVCLICLKKWTKELSCMRYHLLNKHSINHKHSLFQEAYYQMSLKEIANEEKQKSPSGKDIIDQRLKGIKATGLQKKLIERAKLVQDKLKSLPKFDDSERSTQNPKDRNYAFWKVDCHSKKPKKIVTAENGMKLVKLPDGQFRKFTSSCN